MVLSEHEYEEADRSTNMEIRQLLDVRNDFQCFCYQCGCDHEIQYGKIQDWKKIGHSDMRLLLLQPLSGLKKNI